MYRVVSAERNPAEADNPISSAINLQNLKSSGDPNANVNAQILEQLKALSADVGELKRRSRFAKDPVVLRPDSILVKAGETITIRDLVKQASGQLAWIHAETLATTPIKTTPRLILSSDG